LDSFTPSGRKRHTGRQGIVYSGQCHSQKAHKLTPTPINRGNLEVLIALLKNGEEAGYSVLMLPHRNRKVPGNRRHGAQDLTGSATGHMIYYLPPKPVQGLQKSRRLIVLKGLINLIEEEGGH